MRTQDGKNGAVPLGEQSYSNNPKPVGRNKNIIIIKIGSPNAALVAVC